MRASIDRDQVAFTLIELLAVIGIVGIIAALLLPAFAEAQAHARATTCKNHLRQMGIGLKTYVDENHDKYPHYLGPPGPAYGDAVGQSGSAKDLVYWSSKLFPYYPLNWTNSANHCPAYNGLIEGPGRPRGSIVRLGSYAYNTSGVRMDDRINEHLGRGPVLFWRLSPTACVPAVREAQVKVPGAILAISESRFLQSKMDLIPGSQDDRRCGLKLQSYFDAALHGKNYNQLWYDGHVSGMSPSVLFSPAKTAAMWNYDHPPHPEMWML